MPVRTVFSPLIVNTWSLPGGIDGRLCMNISEAKSDGFKTKAYNANMTTNVAHQRISRDLLDAEVALDEALLRQSQLLSTMVHARRETGVSPFMGQDALMRLVRSQQAMLNAGGELARVHGRLSDIAVEMVAGNDPCPTPAFGMAESDGGIADQPFVLDDMAA
jgi:hypothetical protein